MGEIANDIIAGVICDLCMFPLQEEYGIATTCTQCGGKGERWEPTEDQLKEIEEAEQELNGG